MFISNRQATQISDYGVRSRDPVLQTNDRLRTSGGTSSGDRVRAVTYKPEITAISQPASQPRMLYLVSDWEPSRNRTDIGGASVSAAKKIAGGAAFGASVGTAVPVIGTAAGGIIGGGISAVRNFFGGSKPDRLIVHLEEFARTLFSETFGAGSYKVGVSDVSGNGENAPVLTGQYPPEQMKQFLLEAFKQYLNTIQQAPNANSGDRASMRQVAASLRFTEQPPARGSGAIYAAFKPEKIQYTETENGISQNGEAKEVTQKSRDQKKIGGGVLAALAALTLLR